MSHKIFPDAFRKIVKACSNVEIVKACSNVEERRFSAASNVLDDVGFSPGRRCSVQPFRQPARRVLTGALFAIALLTLSVFSPFSARAQKPVQATVTAALPEGPMQAKATTACLECHEARIILQQRLAKAAWTKEVDKMTKWGAVVDPADRDALIDYLSSNFSPDKPAYQPQRTANAGKVSK